MALLLRIFLLFTILCTGYSIKCYKCESEKLYGCAKDAKPKEYDCGTLLVEHRYFCVYLVAHNIVMNITYAKSYCLAGLKETPVDKVIVPECHRVPGRILTSFTDLRP